MEILGIGTEIVECLRIGKMIEMHGEMFLRRVYTDREIRYCQTRKHATGHFAGHWAAKQAIVRAMAIPLNRGVIWTDIEVRHGQSGKALVKVCGLAKEIALERKIGDVLLTISHCRTYATAYAIALIRPVNSPGPSQKTDEPETKPDPSE